MARLPIGSLFLLLGLKKTVTLIRKQVSIRLI